MLRRCFIVAAQLIAWTAWLIVPGSVFSENPADEHVKLELISEQDAIRPDREIWMGVRFDLANGWHTYWVNTGDSGEAPRIEWELPAGFMAGEIQWPYPERMPTTALVDYGYEHQVLLIVAVRPPPRLTGAVSQKIAARVHYLVCHDVCIPGQQRVELTLPVKSWAVASSAAQLFEVTRQRLPRPVPSNWKISAASIGDEFVLNVRNGKFVSAAQFFPLEPEQIENAASQRMTTIPGGIRLHLKKSKQLLKPISRLEGVLVIGSRNAYLVNVHVSTNQQNSNRRP